MLAFISAAGCTESFLSRLWVGLGWLPKPCSPLCRLVMPRTRWVPCASPCSPPGMKSALLHPAAGFSGVFHLCTPQAAVEGLQRLLTYLLLVVINQNEWREQISPGTKHGEIFSIKWEVSCVELTLTPYFLFGCKGRVFEQTRRLNSCLQDNDQLLPLLII